MRAMRPRATLLERKAVGSMGGTYVNALEPLGRHFVTMRFDRSLNYINVAAFKDTVLEVLAHYPEVRGILVIGSGINEIDASGVDKVSELAQRLQQGVALMFSSLEAQVAAVFERAGLMDQLGPGNVFPSKERAVEDARRRFDMVPA